MPVTATAAPTEKITEVVHKEDFTTPWDHIVNQDQSVSKVRLTQKTMLLGEAECNLSQFQPARVGASFYFGRSSVPAGHSIADPPQSYQTGYRDQDKVVEYHWEVKRSSRDASTVAPENKTVSHTVNHGFSGTECKTKTTEMVRIITSCVQSITDKQGTMDQSIQKRRRRKRKNRRKRRRTRKELCGCKCPR
jgi:hypothetical protein